MIEAQNVEYIPLMEEREAEYQKEMMEKMEKFRMEHAARVLQGAWRGVLANRAEKKKVNTNCPINILYYCYLFLTVNTHNIEKYKEQKYLI